MNKFKILLFTLLSMGTYGFSQHDNVSETSPLLNGTDNNELKMNLVMAIAGLPEVTYERFIADNMGVGLSVAISVDDIQDYKSIILPYYRVYFSNKKAAGFFIEGNMAVATEKEDNYYYDYYYPYQLVNTNKSNTYFGLGAAVGVKFMTRNNFIGEVYLGAGRLFGNSYSDAFPRIGITLGKRF